MHFQKIGDFYRGWVETEVELDLLLTYHKQQTASMWGTRQSPSAGKPSTRLMWKSQYVPFDGSPFVNAGERLATCCMNLYLICSCIAATCTCDMLKYM